MALGENPAQPNSSPVPVAHTFSPKKRAAFLLALVETGSIAGAAAKIGVNRATVYRAAEANETFRDDIERARGQWEQALVEGVAKAGLRGKVIETRKGTKVEEPGDWRALAWLLEHAPATRERYAGILRQKVEVGGDPDGVPIQTQSENVNIEIGPDTMDRLARVVEVLMRAGKLRLPDMNEIEGEYKEVQGNADEV